MLLSCSLVLLTTAAVSAWPFREGIIPGKPELQKTCEPLQCQLYCEDDYVEIDGCPICQCVADKVSPKGVEACAKAKCNVKCEYGFVYEDNCKTCACRPNPCDLVKCGYLQHCEVQAVLCVQEPHAICIDDNICLPSNDWNLMNNCENECTSEYDCSGKRLCCNNGCGRVCSNRGVIIRKQKTKKNDDIVCDNMEHL